MATSSAKTRARRPPRSGKNDKSGSKNSGAHSHGGRDSRVCSSHIPATNAAAAKSGIGGIIGNFRRKTPRNFCASPAEFSFNRGGVSYYNAGVMDFSLSPEQEMLVATVREFVEKEVYPLESEAEKTGAVSPEVGAAIKQKCRDIGFYAANMPQEVGGGGLCNLDFALLERELGRGAMGLTVFFGRPSNILMACRDEQREKYLLPAVRGDKMDALAMTEPAAGSDIRGMRCFAAQKNGDWVVNGGKHFISHADIADFFYRIRRQRRRRNAARNAQKNHLLFGRPGCARIFGASGLSLGVASRLSKRRFAF